MAAIIKLSENEWVKFFFVQMVGREVWVKFFCANGGNQSWQVWVSLRGKTKMAEFKMAEFKMAAIIKLSENEWVLSQIELVWVRVRVEGECFWVNLREDNKVSESKMAEFKMAAIIKLSQNEWVKVFFVQMVGTNLGKCEWVWEEKLRCLDAPIYLDDVWMPPIHTQHRERILCQTKEVSTCLHTSACPLYINNTMKACFVRLRGVHMPPLI